MNRKKKLNDYLDQEAYLKRWSGYDNGSPTGIPEEDAEPSPALRCQFCKDIKIDIYDEDLLVYKYYSHPADAKTLARDMSADIKEIRKLFKSKSVLNCNALHFSAIRKSRVCWFLHLNKLKKSFLKPPRTMVW